MSNEITVAGSLIQIISQSRQNALKKVNEELINMYWKIGEHLSTESEKASFGDAYIDTVAEEIQNAFPGTKDHPHTWILMFLFFLPIKRLQIEIHLGNIFWLKSANL